MWQYWLGISAMVITLVLAALVVIKWEAVQDLAGVSYLGLFIISALGGATVIIPVPTLAVQFAMGGVLQPWFGPAIIGPLFVGVVAGFAETIGALSIYLTGFGGGTSLARSSEKGRLHRMYLKLTKLMERRGKLTLFLVSAIINPFFYPVSLAAGAVRFGIWKFFAIAWAGKTIKCIGIAYAGYYGLRGLFEMLGISLP
jgi:membrane protein YqaA with SNARE-associated domain